MTTKKCKCGIEIRLYNLKQAIKELREKLIVAKLYNCMECQTWINKRINELNIIKETQK